MTIRNTVPQPPRLRVEDGAAGEEGPQRLNTTAQAEMPTAPEENAAPTATLRTVEATPEGRRERHRRETFERLVRAAREIMFSRGFNDITVQDITDAADVGKGTFFNYFRSKEHVVSRVQEYNRRTMVSAVEQVRRGERTPIDALTDILAAQLCPADGLWLTYQSNTMRALALNPDVRLLFSPELEQNRQSYEAMSAIGQQQGTLRTDLSPADLAMIMQTFFAGLTVVFWIHGITPTPALVSEVTQKFGVLLASPLPSPPSAPTVAVPGPKRKSSAGTRSKARATRRPPARSTRQGRRTGSKRR